MWIAESIAFTPLGVLVWLTRYRDDGGEHPALIRDARGRAIGMLENTAKLLGPGPWLLGERFTAADIMLGFTLIAARILDVLKDGPDELGAYLARLEERPALRRALQAG